MHTFEAEHGAVLPEPYRTFVAEIADGSPAGPPGQGPVGLTVGWIWEDDEETPEEELDARVGEVCNHGPIVLGTDGCGMYWLLVVTGPHRGRVWCVTDVGATPFDATPFDAGSDCTGTATTATTATATTAASGFADRVAHWRVGRPWFDADA
ncbi:SMI1/KNR4 family protein [Kitasatospora phosalacinea]|uniref:SMI1/KNR4 family protein n=1 Tax=Kitasatospora phosalacinea TaxID=2065 RepID=A0ABW6GI68_9ACTN